MKQMLVKRIAIGLLFCAATGASFAQKEKAKDKKNIQQIVISRDGDTDEKTVIEINGNKVKINGKDVSEIKDIKVHINNMNIPAIALRASGHGDFDFKFDDGHMSIYNVDSNKAMLGVVTEADAKGAGVSSVSKESAAEKAGLKKGDIITKIDSKKIESTDDVTEAIRSHKPGEKVAITYLRDGKEQKTTAELGKWKGVNIRAMSMPKILGDQMWREEMNQNMIMREPGRMQGTFFFNKAAKLGMSVQDTDEGKGVKVLDVDDEGTAAKAGIKEDDIILKVDDTDINSADDMAKLMKQKKDQSSIKIQLKRNGQTQNVEVRMPKKIKTVDL